MIERDFRKLSAVVQAEIQKVADRLGEQPDVALYPVISEFQVGSHEYKAYFVPIKHADGRVEFIFECLFY